jgi:uncharacterized protein
MNNKEYMNYNQMQTYLLQILRQMQTNWWQPDYIVGINKGGLLPGVLMSNYLNVPMYALKVTFKDGHPIDCESNAWMSEDAYDRKNILIINDIINTGATFNWIKEDWESGCRPGADEWKNIWHHNVKFAAIINNVVINQKVDYFGRHTDKSQNLDHIVFPTEEWWDRPNI